ncbi:MAG: hypothetical protein HY314_06750 [Acidobacteria bacterium]|nr:hypothetical protein [Acidobacteriota bacterium]
MARGRTTKELAERIDLDYFKQSHPMRRWMRFMLLSAAGLAGVWLIVGAIRGDQSAYIPGPVSTRHAMFAEQCTQCHAPMNKEIYWRRISDQACLKCHDGPIHHQDQTFAINCGSCHIEHKDRTDLVHVSNGHCTQCHSRLKTSGSSPHAADCLIAGHRIEPRVGNFNTNHPEFAIWRNQYHDVAQIKLNHQVHLKPDLKGLGKLRGNPGVTEEAGRPSLNCAYCHQPDSTRAYLAPINYEKHCQACHALQFDRRFPNTIVPHEKIEVVVPFVQEKFDQYILDHPEALKQQRIELIRRLPGESRYKQLPATAQAWVDRQVEDAKTLLFRKTCVECHMLQPHEGTLPTVIPPKIPTRWLVHSTFNHGAHRALTCTACHEQTPRSQKTSDLLLPNIKSCRECHNQSAGAETSCAECHTYHDQTKERTLDGPFTIQQLLK